MKKAIFFLFLINTILPIHSQHARDEYISKIYTSSTLEDDIRLYEANFLIDDTDLSWVEGEPDDGIGQKIKIYFDRKVTISTLYIKNGYGRYNYYYSNNRPKQISIKIANDSAFYNIRLKDNPGFQEINFSELTTDCLEIEILSVYEGNSYNDTAIAEISFNNWNELNHVNQNQTIISFIISDILNIKRRIIRESRHDTVYNYTVNTDLKYVEISENSDFIRISPYYNRDGTINILSQKYNSISYPFNENNFYGERYSIVNYQHFRRNKLLNALINMYELPDIDRVKRFAKYPITDELIEMTYQSFDTAVKENIPFSNYIFRFYGINPFLALTPGWYFKTNVRHNGFGFTEYYDNYSGR